MKQLKALDAMAVEVLWQHFKEIVHPKMQSFTHPHVVTNLNAFFLFVGT